VGSLAGLPQLGIHHAPSNMEFDDGHYEVANVRCSDGRKYDLEFDTAFKLTKKKKLDD
jgi:hypothetical protein